MAGWCFGGRGRRPDDEGGLRTTANVGVSFVESTVIEIVGGSDRLTGLEGKPGWEGKREGREETDGKGGAEELHDDMAWRF